MDPRRPVARSFWETTFFALPWSEHDQWRDGLVRCIYALRDQQQQRIASGVAAGAKAATGIYESDFDLLDRDDPSLKALRQFIVSTVAQVVSHMNRNEVPETDLNVHIRDSWFHITNDGGFHDSHFHGHCSWCGIYYLQVGESGPTADGAPNGGNRFYSPLWSGGQFVDYGNQYLNTTYVDPPMRDGMLLLFPSFLLHSGLPYRGAQDRIVISFNSSTTLRPTTAG